MSSSRKFSASSHELRQDFSIAARHTTIAIENADGETVSIDPANFGILRSSDHYLFLPLNLPEPLQKPGIKVRFSGNVKQTDPEEFWAAQPIILTGIEEE